MGKMCNMIQFYVRWSSLPTREFISLNWNASTPYSYQCDHVSAQTVLLFHL
jgi:hypothetical protein